MKRRQDRPDSASPGLLGGHLTRVVIAAMLTLSFCLGMGVDRFTADNADAGSSLQDAQGYDVLQQTWDLIQNDYVALDQVNEADLMYGAASGMVNALGDTGHSRFLNPKEAERFNASSEGEFVGIGIQLDFTTGQPVVAFPLDGSPAEKAGIRAKDIIIEVDGTSTEGLTQEQVQDLLLGKEGDPVSLKILRPSTGETLDFTIVRQKIEVNAVTYAMLPDNVALIRLSQFSTGVTNEMKAAIRAVKRAGATSIILDLRDNGGGLVFEAIGVASQFIPEGKTIYMYQEKGQDPRPVKTVPGGLATDMPMVTLINHGSASAAEITAGALSDNGRSPLIGETTFGTGTVLTPYNLDDGSIVLLGTALWLEPDGEQIWKHGVAPDDEVSLPADADQIRPSVGGEISSSELQASTDSQLKAAYQKITGKDFSADVR
ncbi:MAG TPA: S41 family peptidase [Thermomicrobiales bacterium]|jgi:carboxyl-terminal processing protease|nr:S41 family peptidase [Thermomicrobiales bacterium]